MKSNKRVPASKRKISALPFESEMNRDELRKIKFPKIFLTFSLFQNLKLRNVEEEVTACFWPCIFCWEAQKQVAI